jgi:serine/threonine-protein kinase
MQEKEDSKVVKSADGSTYVMIDVTVPGNADTLPIGAKAGGHEPQQVGRYQVSERIGRGGMASVFRAYDPGIDRVLAIKFLHTAYCEDEGYRARFLREARAAGMLSHPNIVTVYDVGEIQRRPYMAMELIEGEPLNDLIARVGPMPVRQVLEIGLQLALALDYAHGKGLVHRDIKPANVMLLPDGHTVKVMDFGIAHIATKGDMHTTRAGDVLGTPQYMSPEQTQGAKVDGRSDLFSVGIMLYLMLTGQPPFQGDSLVALAMKIVNEPPPPLEGLRPDVPQALRRIVERCLAKQPAQRFQTGAELAQALRQLQREMEEDAREREREPIVPLRMKWALMMGAIVLVVMGITGSVIHRQQSAAMIAQVTDYGASLGRFIAAQSAVSALGDEWDAVEVSVQEIMRTGDFASIQVMDSNGTVKASSNPAEVDKPYAPRAGEPLGTSKGGVKIRRYQLKGDDVLGFQAPITFQGKTVGLVDLGIAERPLVSVANLSLTLMGVLVVVTVLAVAVAMYFVANWFARPIKLLRRAMMDVGHGHFEQRITEQRRDEYAALYVAFNNMAQALHERIVAAHAPLSAAAKSAESVGELSSTLPPPAAVTEPAPIDPPGEFAKTQLMKTQPPAAQR